MTGSVVFLHEAVQNKARGTNNRYALNHSLKIKKIIDEASITKFILTFCVILHPVVTYKLQQQAPKVLNE